MTGIATSIGVQIDAYVEVLYKCPSVAYVSLFVFSIVFSYVLLNSDEQESKPFSGPKREEVKNRPSNEPQPKWYILKTLNYAAVISFLVSLVKFGSDATRYMNDSSSFSKFLVAWGIFLCYFIGFFGISFVDADEIAEQEMKSIKIKKVKSPRKSICIDERLKKSISSKCSNEKSRRIEELSDEEIAGLVVNNEMKDHELEKRLDAQRAVVVRRLAFESKLSNPDALSDLPYEHYDYKRVLGANCEIVVGYVPIPVGIVGPLKLNDKLVHIPMATTEGCLVASTNRGCKAISAGSGAMSTIVRDGITRAPCLRMSSAKEACELKLWCEEQDNFSEMKKAFESTTSFGKLLSADPTVAGKNVYLRLKCSSGDAMGMNMVSKGSLAVVDLLREYFPSLTLVALSGNMCTDKKAAATNWIEGRGKSVVVEALIPERIVRTILKTDIATLVSTNLQKNLIGSAMAGAVGGFNAHASNIVTAVFLATGQDPAQNVESSNCITLMEEVDGNLWISCTMPSIEVGTVGGGTSLPAQSSCLKVVGCKGGASTPGANAKQLAHVVAAATMAGELSLIAALASNTLVQAHMKHNRKT